MAGTEITVDMARIVPRLDMTIKVKKSGIMRARLWLARLLFYVAAGVLGVGSVEFEEYK